MTISGQCLCGDTQVEIKSDHPYQIQCHCRNCQRISGSPGLSIILPALEDVTLTGSTKEYATKGDTGNPVSYVFCDNCGSSIAHKINGRPFMGVHTGILNDFVDVPFSAEIWTRSKFKGLPDIPEVRQFKENPPVPPQPAEDSTASENDI